MKFTRYLKLLACFVICARLSAAEHPELKAYPPGDDARIRHVIVLPELADEDEVKVELIVGKIVLGDGVNRMMIGGRLEEKVIEGWGYSYFEAKAGPVASTLMAPMEDQPPVARFVSMPGKLIRYNSRLPVVVYTEADMQVRYRIWKAGETRPAEQN